MTAAPRHPSASSRAGMVALVAVVVAACADGGATADRSGPSSASSAPSMSSPTAPPAVVATAVASLDQPVDLATRPGDDALYVVEQPGRVVRVVGEEAITVLDLTGRVSTGGERGLLGLAFSADGASAYLNYTDTAGDTVIAASAVGPDGTFAAADATRTVLTIDQPYANHNGGDLAFGPDGLLYVGMGDGGAGGDPERRATDLTSPLGKLLRIDPAGTGEDAYSVPADNPFLDTPDAVAEIWASGLRNPWRFSFDAATGDLWIADVGQNAVEEVDVAPAVDGRDAGRGANFGWSAFEGDRPYNDDVAVESPIVPVYTYTHGEGCSVSGGVRVRDGGIAGLDGWYVFGDYCAGDVWALPVTGAGASLSVGERATLLEDVGSITAVVQPPAGAVYVLTHEGDVLRLDAA